MQQNLNDTYAEFLKNLSIPALNTMQEAVIEKTALADNVMLLAPTGSGKTLAFLISVMGILHTAGKGVQALIVAPSRELSLQIEQVFRTMKTNFKVSCCYGGHSVKIEQSSLSQAPALIIGTPGRLADHVARKSFDASTIKMVVLDEFDKSLQMGFHEQLKVIFRALSGSQKHLLTSATRLGILPDFLPFTKVETLNHLKDEADSKLKLSLVKTKSTDKVETLMRLVADFNQEVCLIFCNHRDAVERISALFERHKFAHGIFHGAMEQIDREKNLIKFRGGAHNVLIATDLAARGLDIPAIRHVVHYQLPPHHEEFVHRNGRTARMHADGEAYLILADDESLPDYIDRTIEEIKLTKPLQLPPPPKYACLYVSVGKKDKISKGDIAGLFMKKGALHGDDLGLITTLDHASYVAVKQSLVKKLLTSIKDEKLKKMRVKIEIAN
ncbi:MAG: DEAD/DEAH box helicase [Cyclobacteriaceae bacterium]|nr:DEAD/DEAH box helicase [Cyclobacteriaceae bacterium]MDH4296377.1 DEAD/DEAH box helicase [Cyclobacteriaceae bacterium]MDH5251425.1 DEAD/DEAH box helicase [Cyclobacteriaceae bacterium]